MPWHADRPGRNENAPTASVDRPSSWLTGEPRFGFAVRQAADAGAQARTMQDTPFVLSDWDVDGSSRHWPTRRQRGRTGGAGGLKPDVALTSPSSAGAPGSVAKPASGANNACARDRAMPFRQRAGGRRSAATIAAARSISNGVPGNLRAAGNSLCGLEALP
jgi:hypothetical protein